jgi:hypothetical protein
MLYDVQGILQNHSIKYGTSGSIAEHIFWTLRAIRASRINDVRKIQRCCQAYPFLSNFFSAEFTNVKNEEIHKKLGELVNCDIAEMDKKIDEISNPTDKDAARHKIHHWSMAWSPKRRKVKAMSILREDGSACNSSSDAAQVLHNHWQPKFVTPVIKGVDMEPLLPYIQNVQACNDIQWVLPFSDFCAIVSSKKDSGVGPDGIPYSAYKLTGDIGCETLFNCYVFIMNGAPPLLALIMRSSGAFPRLR